MDEPIIIRNNSHACSFNNDDETSITIYSAKLLNTCSQSQRLFVESILLLITMILSIDNVR